MRPGASLRAGAAVVRRVAAGSFGVPVAQLYAGDVPGGEADPLAVVTAMLGRGIPMLALVHGAVLGRGEGYGNHWIVLWRDARATGTMHLHHHAGDGNDASASRSDDGLDAPASPRRRWQ